MSTLLSIELDRGSSLSMTAQIQTAIRERILDGTLHAGTRLPSSRHLAADLDVSRSVVVQAYEQMIAEGYLRAAQGSGTRVATHLPPRTSAGQEATSTAVRFDLRTDTTSMALFPGREWLVAYQRALRSMDRGPQPGSSRTGVPELRAELAGYLGRARGVLTGANELVITSGFGHSLTALATALGDLGVDRIAVENPGDQRHAQAARRAGLGIVPVPVDSDGVDVRQLAASGARAVLVNPVASMPTRATLSAERRNALLGWAAAVGGWVIEYDPDGHLWLGRGGGPLAVQRHLPDRVIYAGETRGLLGPCLRLGWFAASAPVLAALERTFVEPDALTQLAFADFLSRGLLDHHVRQVRGTYRARREALREAVQRHLPGATMTGANAGTHAYVLLPAGVDGARLAAIARDRSVFVDTTARFRLDRRPAETALVLGYAAVERGRLDEAVGVLGQAMRSATRLSA